MRRLEEYTSEELAVMDENAITNLVNVECAHEGAPLMSVVAPEAPTKPDVLPDVQAWKVQYRGELRFATQEEAQRVADWVNGLQRLDTEGIGKHSWQAPFQLVPMDDDTATVVGERHWTPSHYQQHQEVLEKYAELKERFDKANREFREQREARDRVCRTVTARIEEAREELRRAERLRTQFEEYCVLADGDADLALTFLLKATPHDESYVRTTLGREDENNGQEGE